MRFALDKRLSSYTDHICQRVLWWTKILTLFQNLVFWMKTKNKNSDVAVLKQTATETATATELVELRFRNRISGSAVNPSRLIWSDKNGSIAKWFSSKDFSKQSMYGSLGSNKTWKVYMSLLFQTSTMLFETSFHVEKDKKQRNTVFGSKKGWTWKLI